MSASLLSGAEAIGIGHAPLLRERFARSGKRAWCYFAPFLVSYSLPPGRVVYVVERGESLLMLVKSEGRRGRAIDLVVPPLPMDLDLMASVEDELGTDDSGRPLRIHWLDGADGALLDPERYEISVKEEEYLYDPKLVWAAEGHGYKDLRKRVRRFERETKATFRELAPEDVAAAGDLLRHWRSRQGRKHPFLLDWGYTHAALDAYEEWDREMLNGWCVESDGRIVAFALAGQMLPGLANFFVAKADPDVKGLSEYLRWRVMGELRDYDRVNDAGDLGLPGLRQHKQRLRPAEEVAVYKAQKRKERWKQGRFDT